MSLDGLTDSMVPLWNDANMRAYFGNFCMKSTAPHNYHALESKAAENVYERAITQAFASLPKTHIQICLSPYTTHHTTI